MKVTPMEIAIDKYMNLHRALSSPRTVEYYEDVFRNFYEFIKNRGIIYVSDFSQDDFLAYITMLRNRGIKNVSVNTYTRGIRAFANFCAANDFIDKSFTTGIRNLRDDSAQIFPLTSKQVRDIDEYLGQDPYTYEFKSTFALRNYLIFHLMLDCGLRRQEVINLNIEDIQVNCLVIQNTKFNKSRIVPLPEKLLDYINLYLSGRSSGAVLLAKSKERLTANCIRKIFYSMKKTTRIPVHPHMLRHTFATSFIVGGGNLEFLRILLGHASYNVTQRYLHIAALCMISDIDIYRLDKCFFKNYNNREVF